jgi:tetratricopeptide (TPR) repeat protein
MPLRNALIVYQSEFLNQPMAFVGTLKESQQIDSNDLELNFIHLNLLKKSNQMAKAMKKCEKLVSLQPQNPYWLYEISDLYGQTGDSVNAKIYLNLAVKLQRKQQETK